MNRRQIRCFLTVMNSGSIKEAAEKLMISPQGLSKTILAIEEETGRPLFVRSRKGLKPTAFAEKLKPRALNVLTACEELDKSIDADPAGKEVLEVVAAYGFLCRLTPGFIDDFYRENPGVLLNLMEMTDYPAIEKLERGDVELAVLPSPLDTTRFVGEPLFTARHCCIISTENPLSEKKEIRYEDLAGQPLALKGRSYIMYNGNINRFLSRGTDPNIYLETSSDELIADLAEKNQAVGISLDYLAERDRRPGTVVRLFEDPTCCRTLYLARAIGTVLSGTAEAFRRKLLETVGDISCQI